MLDTSRSYKLALLLGSKVAELFRDRFISFLERIVETIHVKEECPFSESEEAQLQRVFKVPEEDLQCLVSMAVYTFQQAAFHSLQPMVLREEVLAAGGTTLLADAFSHVWAASEKRVTQRLKEQSFGASGHLVGVEWRVQLRSLAGSEECQTAPQGVLELDIHPPAGQPKESKVFVEFSSSELYNFFEKLEHVQEQLDVLTN
mmetsp:Transcript_35413/g.49157  ORF Transcript_35413/g.49157 Transcript_35413/m.49157 type:complete len:202 (+) Transcript_35413:30-635(+)